MHPPVKMENNANKMDEIREGAEEEVECPAFAFVKIDDFEEAGEEKGFEMVAGKKKLRFSIQDDINLLRETIGLNPFGDFSKWKVITDNMVQVSNKPFSIRTVRDHVNHLLKIWKKEEKAIRKKSGSEEQYLEKELLLREALSLREEYESRPKKRLKKEEDVQLKNEALRNMQVVCLNDASVSLNGNLLLVFNNESNTAEASALEVVSIENVLYENSAALSVPQSRTIMQPQLKEDIMEYLKRKGEIEKRNQEMERNVRKEELEIEKRKLELQERQRVLEEKKSVLEEERLREKMRLDALKQEEYLKLADQQRKLLNIFIKKFSEEK